MTGRDSRAKLQRQAAELEPQLIPSGLDAGPSSSDQQG
jgi:hypothetical protein